MKFLKKASNMQAYAKVGFFGFQGSGKTYTAMMIAKGLCDLTSNKRIAFFDTETGSDWWVSRCDGYEFFQIKSRAFKDLLGTIRECESEGVAVLVIDSITHIWRDIIESYQRKKDIKRLRFQDWGPIKSTWGMYTDLFVNSKIHIIVCGRAGFDYDYQEDDRGKLELIKTGTKMKAESEFGFEPSLVIEMEAERSSADVGSGIVNTAHVIKDRSNTINGKSFKMPTFESFKTHFDSLNLGGEHIGVDVESNSEELFDGNGDNVWGAEQRERKIALDEFAEEMTKHFPGRTAQALKCKGDMLEAIFNTRSWERISNYFKARELQWGLLKARWFLNDIDNESRQLALEAGTEGGKVINPNAAVVEIQKLLDSNFPRVEVAE